VSSGNDKTLKAYNDHIDQYIASMATTGYSDLMIWLDEALALLPPGGLVLEIGTGTGREADYIESRGFKISRSDAASAFVDLLRKQGHEARLINALTDDFGGSYDMVIANAVLLHFTPEEARLVLKKALDSLRPGGIFAFTVKEGHGSEWSDAKIDAPRYFHYWQRPALETLVNDSGFTIVNIIPGTSRSAKWLQIIAKK
jgi:SAM-dependent methyltransferase